MRENTIKLIQEHKIIAIVRGVNPEKFAVLADALYAGGIRLMEVTFDMKRPEASKEIAEGISSLVKHVQGRMCIGAGTVISTKLVETAAKAGAKYIISPDCNPDVIKCTRRLGMVSIPGVYTATEVVSAHNAGADFVKVFPASAAGSSYIKALRGPLGHIPMMAAGGINENNLKEYLDAGACGAGIGGNLVSNKWVEAGELDKITALARILCEQAKV